MKGSSSGTAVTRLLSESYMDFTRVVTSRKVTFLEQSLDTEAWAMQEMQEDKTEQEKQGLHETPT